MDRNIKLLWGVIGFAVLMGLVLPSSDDTASDQPGAAKLQAASQAPAAAAPPPQVPMVDMTAEMPTDFTVDAQPTFTGEPSGIDGSPTSGDVSAPGSSFASTPPPSPPPLQVAPGSVVGRSDLGPPLDPTILR